MHSRASLSTWISLGSALIALASLSISVATYRRAGPRVKVRLSVHPDPAAGAERYLVTVRLNNSGLNPAQINRMRLYTTVGSIDFLDEDRIRGSEGSERFGYSLQSNSESESTFRLERGLLTLIVEERSVYHSIKYMAIRYIKMWRPWHLLVIGNMMRLAADTVVVGLGGGQQVSGSSLRLPLRVIRQYGQMAKELGE